MTIYDVQQGKFAPKSVVTIKGVVVTSPIHLKAGKGFVFVEEVAGGEYSGITLELDASVLAAVDTAPGSVIDFTGTYTEFYGNSQIAVLAPGDITVVGTDAIPEPAVVLAADIATGGAKAENYEGVLVQIQEALVTTPNVALGQFEVEGGARVSDYFLFDLGQTPKPQQGQVYASITGPLLTDNDSALIVPRSLDDLDDGSGDTTGGSSTGDTTDGSTTGSSSTTSDSTTGEPPTGIYAVQQGFYNPGDVVILEGVIATSGLTFNKLGFFVQEPAGGPYSGIFIFNNKAVFNVAPGDVLTIAGTYQEFNELSELSVPGAANIMKTGTAPVPAPVLVTSAEIGTGGALSEQYESVLVKIQNAKVSAPVDANNEFVVDNVLHVDDLFFAAANWPKPMIGDVYTSIVGPLNFGAANFKLVPRTANDLVK
jgi:predicted extracellular nuclease